jgi:predicted dithiol-disulfide oxidoreductase (DUF899 family)
MQGEAAEDVPMRAAFPGETAEYRAARDRLLEQEIALRRHREAVAAARRALPPGGLVPEDYAFDAIGADGTTTEVRLSELFGEGKDSLIVYDMMFPAPWQPMCNVFQRTGDGVRHFWSAEMLYAPADPGQDPRHMGTVEPLWTMMDFTREGRPDWHEQLQYECCR